MLTRVEVSTDQGTTLTLPLEYTNEGYLVQEIEGLDPVKATIVSSSFANMDGEQYQSSRRESRNIVIKLGLESGMGGSVRDLRSRLYGFFMPKARIRLRFLSDEEPSVDIYGVVESCLSPLFTKDPVATISILCHQPDFYIPTPVELIRSTSSAAFVINYEGTIETGIELTMLVDRALEGFTIYHQSSADALSSLEFESSLIAGDVLKISTVTGAKGATLTRSGSNISVLYGISSYSNWINLFPGSNLVRVDSGGEPVPYSITYTNKIGGL